MSPDEHFVTLLLLLLLPASSVEAECSFSALHRLQTWLHSTMTETRLNAISVCHVNQQTLHANDNRQLLHKSVSCYDNSRSAFEVMCCVNS